MQLLSAAESLVRLHLRLNRRRMLIARGLGLGIEQATKDHSYVEIAALTVLHARQQQHSTGIQQLADLVGVDQSWMSRCVAKLAQEGCLTLQSDAQDARKRLLRISTRGEAALIAGEETFTKIAQQLCAGLSKQEIRLLIEATRLLADQLGAASTPTQATWELEIEEQFDRWARVFGAFGKEIRGSGISLFEWQLLEVLADGAALPQSEIEQQVAYAQSAISRLCERWCSQGVLIKQESTLDRRHALLRLSPKGQRWFAKLHAELLAVLSEASKALAPAMLEAYRKCLQKICLQTPLPCNKRVTGLIDVRALSNEEARTLVDPSIYKALNGSWSAAYSAGKLVGLRCKSTTPQRCNAYYVFEPSPDKQHQRILKALSLGSGAGS